MTYGRTQQRPRPSQDRGGPCPYTSEWTDEPCGAPADHWSNAVRCYLCGEHYHVVNREFAAMAVELAEDAEARSDDP
jgi:hypothetical protein